MLIENPKTYTNHEVETIFFRPSFCGKSAEEMGVHVIYNMPMPTTVQVFANKGRVLEPFESGWSGSATTKQMQTTVAMNRVKAESSYSAEEYFSTVFEMITNSSDVNLGDLTGTELEKAETELFRKAIAAEVYATMWFGDENSEFSTYDTFNGFVPTLIRTAVDDGKNAHYEVVSENPEKSAVQIFRDAWDKASATVRSLASEGNLAFYVSSDIYDDYQFYLDDNGTNSAYIDMQSGRQKLCYHGIPVIEVPINTTNSDILGSFCILTDSRNLVLALNTASSPENEVRMWYNPDEMENRQRAVFLAGTTIVDLDLVSGFIVSSY